MPSKKTMTEVFKEVSVLTPMVLMMLDEDNPLRKQIEDVFTDLYPVSLDDWKFAIRRGAPIVSTFLDLLDLLDHAFTGEEYEKASKYAQKGDKKVYEDIKDFLPLRKFIKTEEKANENLPNLR